MDISSIKWAPPNDDEHLARLHPLSSNNINGHLHSREHFQKMSTSQNHQTKGGADQIWADQHFVNGPYFLCEQNAKVWPCLHGSDCYKG